MTRDRAHPAGVPSGALLRLIEARIGRVPVELRAAPRRRRASTVLIAATLSIGGAAAGFALAASLLRLAPRPIAYEVENGRLGPRGTIEASNGDAHVCFSDGSDMDIPKGASVSIRDTGAHGALIAIRSGRMHLDVHHLPAARWIIDAGPFEIAVTGTSFTAEWSEADQELEVGMERGSVQVSGPLSDGPIVLRSGQHLTARARERETVIRELDSAAATPLAPVGVTASTTAAPAVSSPLSSPRPLPRHVATAPTSAAASVPAQPDWSAEVAAGRSGSVVAEVEHRGVERCLHDATGAGLAAIADAARFEQRFDLAREALLALRSRFPALGAARDAAFLLGRVDEVEERAASAVGWYEIYSRESPSGAYLSEALGRHMSLSRTLYGPERARPLAREYLQSFPGGAYASAARAILAGPER